MKTLIITIISALALAAQTPTASIVITVVEVVGGKAVTSESQVAGAAAQAGLESLRAWMATQQNCTQAPTPVCTPKFSDPAAVLKQHGITLLEQIAPMFPSSATVADVAAIKSLEDALAAKRKAIFDAARAEKSK